VLRDIPLVPYGEQFGAGKALSARLSPQTPVVLLQNDAILTTGHDVPQAFDRLEVAEFSARAVIDTAALGAMMPIGDDALKEIEAKFLS
jgi:L-fuculose-phosphate aldolase